MGCEVFPAGDDISSTCAVGSSRSCKIKAKLAPKTTGSSKYYVDFCCYEGNECKGDKLGDPTPIPIEVKVDLGGSEVCPAGDTVEPPDPCSFSLAPLPRTSSGELRMSQTPSGSAVSCRGTLGRATTNLVAGATDEVTRCNLNALKEVLPSDCTTADDDKGVIAALIAGVNDSAVSCAATRSPTRLRHGLCSAPCEGLVSQTCAAGGALGSCTTDAECELPPGSGEGRCGIWSETANCINCQIQSAINDASTKIWGDAAYTFDSDVCMSAIGKSFASLVSVRAKELLACQKLKDSAKKATAPEGPCKDADLKGSIAKEEQQAIDTIEGGCQGAPPEVLANVCGGTEASFAGVADCVIAGAKKIADTLSSASYPETDPSQTLISPVTESLQTCEPATTDRYTFTVAAGDNVSLHADTADASTAADLCFGIDSGCTTGDAISGDEDVPCTFTGSLGHDCPQDSFVATGNGTCTVEVTECAGDCTDNNRANYSLTVMKNASPAQLELIADDEP